MSSGENLLRLVSNFANPEEIALLSVIASDDFTRVALANGDMKSLMQVYKVNLYNYEDRLKERYGVVFRNRPNAFEIVQHNQTLYRVQDDLIGSCGTATALMLKERDGCTLPVSYTTASAGRFRHDIDDIFEQFNLKGLSSVAAQVSKEWPILIGQMANVSRLAAVDPAGCTEWYRMEVANTLLEIYTYLRSQPKDCVVNYDQRTTKVATIAQVFLPDFERGTDWTIVPSALSNSSSDSDDEAVERGCFSKAERRMVKMVLRPIGYEKVTDEEGEYYVVSKRSLYWFIGSAFIQFPPLPVWNEATSPVRQINPVPASSSARPVATAYPAAVQLVLEHKNLDMNKFKDIRSSLVQGGLSEQAQKLYGGLSLIRKQGLLRHLNGRMSFDEAVQLTASKNGLEADEVIAEVLAAKLVLAKSAVSSVMQDGVLYIEK